MSEPFKGGSATATHTRPSVPQLQLDDVGGTAADPKRIRSQMQTAETRYAALQAKLTDLAVLVLAEEAHTAEFLAKLETRWKELKDMIESVGAKMRALRARERSAIREEVEVQEESNRLSLREIELERSARSLDERARTIADESSALRDAISDLHKRQELAEKREKQLERAQEDLSGLERSLYRRDQIIAERQSLDLELEHKLVEDELALARFRQETEERAARLAEKERELRNTEDSVTARVRKGDELEVRCSEFEVSDELWRKHRDKYSRSLVEGYRRLAGKQESLGLFDRPESPNSSISSRSNSKII